MNSYAFVQAVEKTIRPAISWSLDAQSQPVPVFNPALSVGEQATYDDLLAMAKFGLANDMTLAEFQTIKPNLADLRPGSALQTAIAALRTRTDAQWNALTAAQRQADQIAWLRDLTDAIADLRAVLGALLRS